MHKLILPLFIAMLAVIPKASACSPSMEYINMPLALKLAGDDFFIGKIQSVNTNKIAFSVIAPGGPAKGKNIGETITLELKDYGTCGSLHFKEGETWLYNGLNISFSPSQKLEPSDLENGPDLAAVKRNLVSRLDPDYAAPRELTKDDMPIPGEYSHEDECGPEDKALGYNSSGYDLAISDPDPTTKMYKIRIDSNICKGGHLCSFSGEAQAYGYGEIVIPIQSPEGMPSRNCSVLVQQRSPASEWPRLTEGQARVRINDPACMSLLESCGAYTTLNSPVLQKR
jgi:hypothetical protein